MTTMVVILTSVRTGSMMVQYFRCGMVAFDVIDSLSALNVRPY